MRKVVASVAAKADGKVPARFLVLPPLSKEVPLILPKDRAVGTHYQTIIGKNGSIVKGSPAVRRDAVGELCFGARQCGNQSIERARRCPTQLLVCILRTHSTSYALVFRHGKISPPFDLASSFSFFSSR